MDRILNEHLGLRVHRRGGLIEDQQPRVVENGARDRDPLSLPARQPHAALSHLRVVGIRQLHDEIVRVGRLCRRDDLSLRRLRPPVRYVLGNAPVEQERLLQHHPDLAAPGPQVVLSQIVSVHVDRAPIRVVEPAHQIHDRGLPHARPAHEPDHLSGGDVQLDVIEHRRPVLVAEVHVVELHRTLHIRRRPALPGPVHLRLRIQHLEHALGGRRRELEPFVEPADLPDRPVQLPQILREHHQGSQLDGAGQNSPRAEIPDQHISEPHDPRDRAHEGAAQLRRAHARLPISLVAEIEALYLPLLLRERLHHPHAGDRVGQHRVDSAHPPPRAPVVAADARPHKGGRQHNERNGHQGQQRQHRLVSEHDGQDDDHREGLNHHLLQILGHEVLDVTRIMCQPGHQLPRLPPLVEPHRQLLKMPVRPRAHIRHHPLPQPGQEVGPRIRQHRPGRKERGEQGDDRAQELPLRACDHIVDDILRQNRRGQLHRGR